MTEASARHSPSAGSDDNPVVRGILRRHSYRGPFSHQAIAQEIIRSIVACGRAAPASKSEPQFLAHPVVDRELLNELAAAIEAAEGLEDYVPLDPQSGEPRSFSSTVAESAEVLRSAPLAIFIEALGGFTSGRASIASASADPELLEDVLIGYALEIISVGAAIQNMWLAAGSFGLRGVFMGDVLVGETVIRQRLEISGDLSGVLALGFPVER